MNPIHPAIPTNHGMMILPILAMITKHLHGSLQLFIRSDNGSRFAKSSEVFLGTPAWHRERLMQAWKV